MKINKKNVILVFGADGFIGTSLCQKLAFNNFKVLACIRKKNMEKVKRLSHRNINILEVGNLLILKKLKIYDKNNISTIINLAAKAHTVEKKILNKDYLEKKSINIEKNIKNNLNNKSIPIIQISSAKVNKKNIIVNKKNYFTYSFMKLKSENYIKENFKKYIILRPPLIFGPEVKANFLLLIKLINYGIPLPIKNLSNLRSYVYLENFTDLIMHIILKNKFTNRAYYVKDSQPISTTNLYIKITKYLNKKPRLFYLNQKIVLKILSLFNKKDVYEKIFQNFIVDNTKITKELNWKPKYNLDIGIKKTCFWYKRRFNIK